MGDDSVVTDLSWEQFENLWTVALEARKSKDNNGLLNLFEDALEVRKAVGEKNIHAFAQSVYCYDLIQQVYSQYFAYDSGDTPKKRIGAGGLLSLSGQLSPASMPLALMSHKEDNFESVSKDDFRSWKSNEHSLRCKLTELDYRRLSWKASEYFPRVKYHPWLILKAIEKHGEINSLISTLRFKHLHYDCATCGRLDCYCTANTSKLRISFREVENTDYEVHMFQKIWFAPVPEADTISVSANLSGFTMINAVSRALGYDWEHVKQVAETANRNREVICFSDLEPRLIIVPKTYGNGSLTRKFLTQVINDANTLGTKILHMTHYGFCNNLSNNIEPQIIFENLLYPHLNTTIESVIFDCDSRAKDRMVDALKSSLMEYKPRFA